ncbi:MAG: hypothetical protein ACO3K7_04405 [Candidatus Marinamargulisbacteria bacterium]
MNDRQKTILTCLVDHFIDSCQPISSTMVKDRLHIQLSPASVRQVFSVLDDGGYIKKRHTSSGRVPTDKGYRAYVDRLTIPSALSLDAHVDAQTYYGKFRFLFDQFLDRLASKIPYITLLNLRGAELRDIAMVQYVSLSAFNGLLLVFHRVGIVSKLPVRFSFDVSGLAHSDLVSWLSSVYPIENRRNELLRASFSQKECDFIEVVHEAMANDDASFLGQPTWLIKNVRKCLSLSDYATKEAVEKVLDVLDDTSTLAQLFGRTSQTNEMSISIGEELKDDRLNESSLISIPMMLSGVPIASLGILGPTRMDYGHMARWFRSEETLAELIQF